MSSVNGVCVNGFWIGLGNVEWSGDWESMVKIMIGREVICVVLVLVVIELVSSVKFVEMMIFKIMVRSSRMFVFGRLLV